MKQILKGGGEHDVLSKARKVYCYTQRAGVCAKIKRKARRRLRHELNSEARHELFEAINRVA